MYRKDIATNHIKRNIMKFDGFRVQDHNSHVAFISENLSEDEIVDICGILEVSATTSTLDNIRSIVRRLTPSELSVDEQEEVSQRSRQSTDALSLRTAVQDLQFSEERNRGCSEKQEIRTLIRKQSITIFDLQQEIFDAEDEVYRTESAENQRQLSRLKSKLKMHQNRREELEAEYSQLQEEKSDSHRSHQSNSVRSVNIPPSVRSANIQSWINSQEMPADTNFENNWSTEMNINKSTTVNSSRFSQPENPPENHLDSFRHEIKTILSRNSQDMVLPDFNGEGENSAIDWSYFKILYDTSTKNLKLSRDENIVRLNKHLKGSARRKVDLLLKSCKNPSSIIDILESDYSGNDKILQDILHKVHCVKQVDCLKKFKDFSCVVQNISSVVTQLDESLFDIQKIMTNLLSKLPDHIIGQWANFLMTNKLCQKDVKLQMFRKWIMDLSAIVSEVSFFRSIHATEYGENVSDTLVKKEENRKHPPTVYKEEPRKKDLPTNIPNKKCALCKLELHALTDCEKFLALQPQQRFSTAKRMNFCVCCLKKHYGSCKRKQACHVNNCGRFHHQLLHSDHSSSTQNITACNVSSSTNVLLKVISVRIRNGDNVKNIVAFLDEGATVSLIDSSLVKDLKISGIPDPICYEGIGKETYEDLTSLKVQFEIAGESSKFYKVCNVNTINNLELPSQTIDMHTLLESYPQLKNMNISNKYSSKPQLLLGQQHASIIVSQNIFEIENGPICSKTKLGWAVHGPVSLNTSKVICCLLEKGTSGTSEEKLDELIRNQFILENYGINGLPEEPVKDNDELCLEIAEKSITKCNGHYEIALPWKNRDVELPNTYPIAMKRLIFLEKKFSQDNNLRQSYEAQIKKLFDRGYARKISFRQIRDQKPVWILPHFAVKNPRKPHKPPRVVFDAAAKVEGKCLNDLLLTGPDWLTSIIGVLIRFRQSRVAFAGDIMEMFNRVQIKDNDTFAQCFLWRNTSTNKIELCQMKAMLFGMKSSPFLAQYVKNYNALQYKSTHPEAYIAITQNHYVDDYLDCRDKDEDALKIIKDVIFVHEQAGFHIRNFVSNSHTVLKALPKDRIADNFNISVESGNNYQKLLGINWNAKTDKLEFNSFSKGIEEILNFMEVPTKRQVLKITMSIFDPLGLLNPITIKARLLMQSISESRIDWDARINSDMFIIWKKWLNEIVNINNIKIPRCYASSSSQEIKRIELHVFNDASNKAYCSAAYYRFCLSDGEYRASLVYSKAKVNPKSAKNGKLTIPKLELMAAVLGVRVAKVVLSESTFDIQQVYYWTDSSTVMVWIQEKKKLPIFESNRVKIILNSSKSSDWKWLSTKVNVADLGTRDNNIKFESNSQWFTGPDFLYKDESQWEQHTGKYNKSLNNVEIVMITVSKTNLSEALPPVKNYSSYQKLVNVTSWIGRFIFNLKQKISKGDSRTFPYPTPSDLSWALNQLIKLSQNESFPEDLKFLQQGSKQPRRLIKQSLIFRDDIMCINGRLSNCTFISENTKYPVVLDGNHHFTKLLVQKLHEDVKHIITQTLVNNFRINYWMPKMKLKIKSIIRQCSFCQKRDSKPVQPQMGPLPECRFMVFSKPFKCSGIDYFGPFKIKNGRRLENRYGVLFTCLTTRAIHIEIACALDSNSCILAIRRMKSRRGYIEEIFSDNGANFKGANVEVLESIKEIHPELMQKELQKIGVYWKNIPPKSPNFGGAWERLIGAFKRAIESLFVCNRNPTDELLHTVFCEAEYLINSRPLYAVSEDPLDSNPIRPNDILIPGEKMEQAQGDFTNDEVTKKTWRTQQYLIDCFWRKFINEYIPNLLLRSKWQDKQRNIKIGDIVYLKEEEIVKGKWPLGLVVKIYPGKDDSVRVVDVKIGDKIFKRAASKLSICNYN